MCGSSRVCLARDVASTLLLLIFVLVVITPTAEAIPAWSRKYEFTCTECHTAWPKLNSYGRDFKMAGFRIPGEDKAIADSNTVLDDFLVLDKSFPLTARLVMRPYDKQKDQASTIRAFHEIELMVGGRIYKDISGWFEVEAEDEEEFNLFVEQGVVGFHPAAEANVVMGWAPPFWADPFDSLADGGRRMTRSHKGPLDLRFAARERLRSQSQFVGFYGYAAGRVFYLGGVSSGGDDPEGGDAKDGFGRVNVRAAPGVYLGGFVLSGTNETQDVDLDFTRAGFDYQIERGNFSVYGLVMNANDDLLQGGDDSWTVGYVEGLYTIKLKPIPMIVPLVRFDFLDDFNGKTDLTFLVNFYLTHNVKAYAEWWQNLDTPSGQKDNRFTVQVDLAF